jgi:GDPmannose 4,6-dehydratase
VNGRTALITGVFGQDGSLLAEHLLGRGYRVTGVIRPGGVAPDDERRALAARCELVELDVGEPSRLVELVSHVEPDEIYHLAACHHSSEPGARDDADEHQRMLAVNTNAVVALAQAVVARRRGNLVVAGSSQMYMPQLPSLRVDEHTPHAPRTFYGETKAQARNAVRALREQHGAHASCAIMFNHESPRRPLSFVSRKVTRSAARIAAGLDTTLELVDLASQVDFSAAADVVVALHAMATAVEPGDYVIASGELRRIEDLCAVAFACVGLDWRDHVRCARPAGERPAIVGDPTSIERELGWRRTRSFETWVGEMVAADQRSLAEQRARP